MTSSKVTLGELSMFVAVVETGSFTEAADRLNQAVSVLSRSVKKLEGKLETTLLHRTTRSIRPTQEGEWLYAKAVEVLKSVTELEQPFLETSNQPSGLIVVDANTPFTLHAITPLIPGFKAKYPNIDVRLESTESNINLIKRNVDIALRIGNLEDSSLHAKRLGTTRRGIYASPDYLEKYGEPKSAEELVKHQCLAFAHPSSLNTWPVLLKNGAPFKVKDTALVSDSGETLCYLAVKGMGLVTLAVFRAKQDVEEGRLVPVLESEWQDEKIPIHFVFYADQEVSPRIRCFMEYITQFIDLRAEK